MIREIKEKEDDELLDYEPLLSYENRGSYIIGQIEEQFARSVNAYNPLLVTSGTSALYLALVAYKFDADSEIILPVNICHSMVDAVIRANLIPVFVDVTVDLCIDLEKMKTAINAKTRAVVLVHPFGMPVQADEYYDYCDKRKIVLIEDCAQAVMAKINFQIVGGTGDIAIYSFGQNKPISAGGGGIICAKDELFAERLRGIAKDGCISGIPHADIGMGLFVNDLQGKYIYNRLCNAEQLIEQKCEKAKCYLDFLQDEIQYIGQEKYGMKGFKNVFHRLVLKIPTVNVTELLKDLYSKYGNIVYELSQDSYPYLPYKSEYIEDYYKQRRREDLCKDNRFSSYLSNKSHYLYLFTHDRIKKEKIEEFAEILRRESLEQ